MASKSEVQTFTQSWDKTVAWAQSHNIPYQAYYPVYKMDAQRMLTGYAMSEGERINAIQAAAGLKATTAIPGDSPNPANVPGNIVKNAQDIFTGLSPFGAGGGLIGNIVDTVRNTLEHPSSVYNGVEDFGKILNPLANQQQTKNAILNLDHLVLSQHNILSWVPGLYDVAMWQTGHGKQLLSQPLTALLDVLPMDKVLPSSIADSAHGDAIAKRMGVTTDELRKMDGIQFGYRMAKTIPLPYKSIQRMTTITDASGQVIGVRPFNVGERINLFRNQLGTGAASGEALKGMTIGGESGTKEARQKLQGVIDTLGTFMQSKKITDQERFDLGHALQNDHRPFQEKINDPGYTDNVKTALEVVHDYTQQDLAMKMAAGEVVPIYTPFVQPDGTIIYREEPYSLRPGSNGAVVQRALDNSKEAQAALDSRAKSFDVMAHQTLILDRQIQNVFDFFNSQTTQVFSTIRSSEPNLAGIAHGIGGQSQDILWEKILETQSPIVRNLLGLPPAVSAAAKRLYPSITQPSSLNLTSHTVNALRDLFSPGGLHDQMIKAQKDMDYEALSKYTDAARKRWNTGTFKNIPKGGPLDLAKQSVERIYKYNQKRVRLRDRMTKLMYGHTDPQLIARGRFTKTSIAGLTKAATKAHERFIQRTIDHPPDFWSNVKNEAMVDQIMANEHAANIVSNEAPKYLSEHGMSMTELDKIRQDPRTLVELFVRASEDSYANGEMPDIDVNLWKSLEKSAYDEIHSLRAMGHAPEYVPMISPFDEERIFREGYNVYIRSIRPNRTISSQLGRSFQFNSSVFNVAAGLLKDGKEQIERDAVREYHNTYVVPHLRDTKEVNAELLRYLQSDIGGAAKARLEKGFHGAPVDAIMRKAIDKMGLVTYDPQSLFGEGFSVPKLDKEYYIDAHLADAIKKGVESFQFPAKGFWDRGTKIFRFSILGLSPRYTAHILFGGTALVAYRGSPTMFRYMGAAAHAFTAGMSSDASREILSPKWRERFPQAHEAFTASATQEGEAERMLHQATMYNAGNWGIREWLDTHNLPHDMPNWLKAAANINYRFTRAVVQAQKAVVYLDGAAKAERDGSFLERVPVQRLNHNGEPALDELNRPIYDSEERRVTMTPDRAHHEGMMALHKTMGELRNMTPLERSILTRAFPFYGWTKHVLSYVLSYPIDHPYRAVFLSQLATQDSENVASGLPTRIQLLTLVGQPDEFGNVTAFDTRSFNPLRDTANYASMTGLLQSLNPIISAPFVYANPEATFGGNEIYPKVSYSQLYGTKQAGPQGSPWNIAEQFVPELTGLDTALNLSGQFSYLKQQGGNSYAKKIFESLNVPFFQPQHINLRQMAAQGEIDRFQQAKADALAAAQSGDMSTLSQYGPNDPIPDPLNPLYTVTPAYIAAMNAESERQFGLPMAATTPSPPNPPLT